MQLCHGVWRRLPSKLLRALVDRRAQLLPVATLLLPRVLVGADSSISCLDRSVCNMATLSLNALLASATATTNATRRTRFAPAAAGFPAKGNNAHPALTSHAGRMMKATMPNGMRCAGNAAISDASAISEALVDEDSYSDSISTWDELKSMASLCYAVNAGSNDVEGICRVMAAEELSPLSTLEILQPAGAAQFYQKFLDGTLFNCATIIDTHYRLLKDCLIQDNYELVQDMYSTLLDKAELDRDLVEAGALVGAQALEYLKEEPEIVVAMLSEMMEGPDFVEEEMRRDYLKAKAMVDGVDRLLEELPVPSN